MNPPTWWQRIRSAVAVYRHLNRHITRLSADLGELQHDRARIDHQVRELAASHAWLQHNHDANVAWLQEVYPEIAAAIGRKIEEEQLQEHNERLMAALYRELDAMRSNATSAASPATSPAAVSVSQGIADPAFYLALEKRFRGTRQGVAERQRPYLDYLANILTPSQPLLDIGCGRGEWLHLLKTHALSASGIDLNPANAASCRAAGLDVSTADACSHLAGLAAGSLGAVTAFQVVEHLEFPVLMEFLRQVCRVLVPGGIVILETPNPENLIVATHTFWLDPTHVRPLPPDLLEFAAHYVGLETVTILRLNPDSAVSADHPEAALLQQHLRGPRDYALIARRPLAAATVQP